MKHVKLYNQYLDKAVQGDTLDVTELAYTLTKKEKLLVIMAKKDISKRRKYHLANRKGARYYRNIEDLARTIGVTAL